MKETIVAAVLSVVFLEACVSTPERGEGDATRAPSWSIQYQGAVQVRNKTYQVVDLFDVTAADLQRLKAARVRPIAYFSSQYEDWRPDAHKSAGSLCRVHSAFNKRAVGHWRRALLDVIVV